MSKNLNEILQQSTYFGAFISILFYWIGYYLQKKLKKPFLNPLLVALVLIIALLSFLQVDYETYQLSAKYITYFLTPATVCLAVPLYKQLTLLKENFAAILIAILAGCISHLIVVAGLSFLFHWNRDFLFSFLPKSVTTPIALGICNETGGMEELTIIGVTIAGLSGSILGPALLKLFHIKNPIAQGLALGTASHAIGTSKAVELGDIQAAVSSVAIVITGIMTVILIPVYIRLFLP